MGTESLSIPLSTHWPVVAGSVPVRVGRGWQSLNGHSPHVRSQTRRVGIVEIVTLLCFQCPGIFLGEGRSLSVWQL